MSVGRDSSLFSEKFYEALSADEVREGLARAVHLDAANLFEAAKEREDQIWQAVDAEWRTIESAQARVAAIELEIDGSVPFRVRTATRFGLLVLVVLVSYFVYCVIPGTSAAFPGSFSDRFWPTFLAFASIGFALVTLLTATSRHRQIAATELGLDPARLVVTDALVAFDTALLEQGMKPALREILNEELAVSWSTELAIRDAPGLAELSDPRYEVSTRAAGELREVVSSLRSGSVGIAGPRGVGKTTLIRALCAANEVVQDTPAAGFVVSAPVRYDPREFLLHLFARLSEFVAGDRADLSRIGVSDLEQESKRQSSQLLVVLAAVLGAAAFAVWLSGASVGSLEQSERLGLGLLLLAALALMVGRFDLVGRSPIQLVPVAPWPAGIVAKLVIRLLRPTTAEQYEGSELVQQALSNLREIRFQQSFSSGWAGSLKLPLGAGMGVDSKLSFAQAQMTLPEIADRFVHFAGRASRDRTILIGIDELDKMESDDAARRFINDIKAVFGVPGCYFLISVSEDAMSNFERRGLPFRDVFDSSFDEILYVPYLDIGDSTQLLRRRIIGLSVPFECLCFVLSGGLARDLIRVTRDVVAVSAASDETALADLAARVLARDLESKDRASVVAVRRADDPACLGAFLEWLRAREGSVRPADLEGQIDAFAAVAERLLGSEDHPGIGDTDAAAATVRVGCELLAYYYFVATVIEFFSQPTLDTRLPDAIGDGTIAKLARGRQDMALSPWTAWATLTDLRAGSGLGPLVMPEVLQGSRPPVPEPA